MTAQHAFEIRLAESWSPQDWRDVTVVVAVSGGPDSVALLTALARLRVPGSGGLVAAHFDHRLRAESEADRQFVESLAVSLDCDSEIGVASAPTTSTGDGVEAAAREARYDFLTEASRKRGARFVVTGHTADDQAETILHRLIRGTGIRGASGIPRARMLVDGVSLLRPLLGITRNCVLDYLTALDQPFQTDATNLQSQYMRNRIRNELLPLLEGYQPGVRDSLIRFGRLAGEQQEVVDQLVDSRIREFVQFDDQAAIVRANGLAETHPFVARAVLQACWVRLGLPQRDMSFAKWESLRRAIVEPDERRPAVMFPGGVRLTHDGDRVKLTRDSASA